MSQNFKKKLELYNFEDRETLRSAGKVLIPHLNDVLSRFYERTMADPDRAAFFSSDARVSSARSAQQKHWEQLFSGNFSDAYLQSAERVGRTHARINLPLETYMSAYACAASDLVEVLLQQSGRKKYLGRSKNEAAQVGAVTRALMLDIDLVVDVTFAVWGEEQTCAFDYLGKAINELAAGNLSHQIPSSANSDFPVAHDAIREQMNKAMAGLGQLIGQLDSSISDLLERLTEVTNATEDLSSRTTSQSATLEETAAAMAQLTASINASAEKTRETSTVGQKAQQDVEHGAMVIGEASQAMNSIQKSSESIANITAAIDDVAFQTNLLALNAGVEAARAGDAGRGFAVVASEVRSLALRSSDAAKDIKGLITTSGDSVEQGATLIGRAESAFNDIVETFDQVSNLTEAVASAFEEQSLGITEINTSIHEMDRTTQLNANMVEETLGAMQAMHSQANAIRGQIAGIQYNRVGGRPSGLGRDDDSGPLLLTA